MTAEVRVITTMLVLMKMIVSKSIVMSEGTIMLTSMINQNQYSPDSSEIGPKQERRSIFCNRS